MNLENFTVMLDGVQSDLEQALKVINALRAQIDKLSIQDAESEKRRARKSSEQKGAAEQYVTAKEAAAHLKISLSTLYLYIKQGKLPKGLSLGGRSKRFRLSELDEAINSLNLGDN